MPLRIDLIYAPIKYLPMSWGLLPLMRRLIAGLLLLLDLSQEPASALPLSMADADNDTVTELCTKETFWCGPSADEQNIYAAIRSKQNAIHADRVLRARPSSEAGCCSVFSEVFRRSLRGDD